MLRELASTILKSERTTDNAVRILDGVVLTQKVTVEERQLLGAALLIFGLLSEQFNLVEEQVRAKNNQVAAHKYISLWSDLYGTSALFEGILQGLKSEAGENLRLHLPTLCVQLHAIWITLYGLMVEFAAEDKNGAELREQFAKLPLAELKQKEIALLG
ncbi:MAG TPA: hypothetical protein PKD37_04230 [Oligoflexia bacterium]|nr:hypothetical protein [Oligoflexia bacterium]HMP27174.1 hypothetical protein [Oligoflexia bacterium]